MRVSEDLGMLLQDSSDVYHVKFPIATIIDFQFLHPTFYWSLHPLQQP